MLGRSALRGVRVRVKSPMEPGENCASNFSGPPLSLTYLDLKNIITQQGSGGFGMFGTGLRLSVLRILGILSKLFLQLLL